MSDADTIRRVLRRSAASVEEREAFERVLAENERLREALERIAASNGENIVDGNIVYGPSMYAAYELRVMEYEARMTCPKCGQYGEGCNCEAVSGR